MKIEFEYNFDDIILIRGYDYFSQGLVKAIKITGNIIKAVVCGSVDYNVYVEIKDGCLEDADCDCPYEAGYCKHLAALLYELNSLDEFEHDDKCNIKDILAKISENEIREFLLKHLTDNEKFYDHFKRKFIGLFPKTTLNEYEEKIKLQIRLAGGRDGFIDYSETYNYTNAMQEFIDEAQALADNKEFDTAFELLMLIIDEIPNINIDDSDGSTGMVSKDCIDIIEEILIELKNDYLNEPLVLKILNHVLAENHTEELANYGLNFGELISFFIENKIYLEKIETFLKNEILMQKKVYSQSRIIKLLINLYIADNRFTEAKKIMKENLANYDILIMYIELLIKQNEPLEAIKLLKEAKQYMEKWYINKISDKLLEIYRKFTMNEELKCELYEQFFHYKKYDLDVFKQIKGLHSADEWQNEWLNIFEKIENEDNLSVIDIFAEEKMIEKVFEMIKNNQIFYTIQRFEKCLIPKYNDQLIDIYLNICQKDASNTNNRKMYAALARQLKHVRKLNNSKEKVNATINSILQSHPGRPAMKDELSKV